MASIQSSPYPLVFKVADPQAHYEFPAIEKNRIGLRTLVRAMEGMQKEALVYYGATGTSWRMVSDEGPYLNGTDLAPFPLAFFTSGLVVSYMSEIMALAALRGVKIRSLELTQDNFYTMIGSALQGTMTGGAKPVELCVTIDADADRAAITELVPAALAASPADALLRDVFTSTFTLTKNGSSLGLDRATPMGIAASPDPEAVFDRMRPVASPDYPSNIIEKVSSAETVFNVEGGASSSLQAEQNRMLHVRGIATLRPDGLKEVKVQLFKPIGSVFRFLADDSARFGGRERAPSGLAYLSAGIGFCFLTQLGRFAHIAKQRLASYRIAQDTGFSLPSVSGRTNMPPSAEPVRTHVYVTSDEVGEGMRHLVDMGEQTCFLHAACRTPLRTNVKIVTPEAAQVRAS